MKSLQELAQERFSKNDNGQHTPEEEEEDQEINGGNNDPNQGSGSDPIDTGQNSPAADGGKPSTSAEPFKFDPDQITDEELSQLLEKRSGGKLKDWNEVEDRLNNYIKPANERIAKANEYASKTGDELEYYKNQTTDWTKIPGNDLVKNQIKSEYPEGLADDVIEAIIADKYHLNDDPESTAFKVGQANLQKDAEMIRSGKIAEQIKLQESPEDRKAVEAGIAAQRAKEEWTRRVDSGLKEFKGLKFDLGNGETFTHAPKDATFVEGLKKALSDTKTLQVLAETNPRRYSGKDGVQKIIEDVYFLNNRNSIVNDAILAAKDGKLNTFVENNLQGSRKNNQPPNGGISGKDLRTQVREKYNQRRA